MMWCCAATGDWCWIGLDTGEKLTVYGCVNSFNQAELNSEMDEWLYLFIKQVRLDDDDDDDEDVDEEHGDQLKWMASDPEMQRTNSS